MAVTIRRAGTSDRDALLDLRAAVAAEGHWIATEAPIDREADRKVLDGRLEAQAAGSGTLFLVATEGDLLLGCLTLDVKRGVAYLGMIVDAAHRGRGVGTRLVEPAITWAREAGCHKISLDHWPWNVAARRLYERFGFVEEGYFRRELRRRDGSLWDLVRMALVLDEESPGHARGATRPPSP